MVTEMDALHPETIPPLVLAYIGDAVYELQVRQRLAARGITNVNQLHREAVRYVNAGTQARLLHYLNPDLDPLEKQIARKGRNAKSGHVPKNTDMSDYRHSTGLECLVGYLFLKKEDHRLDFIFSSLERMLAEQEEKQ